MAILNNHYQHTNLFIQIHIQIFIMNNIINNNLFNNLVDYKKNWCLKMNIKIIRIIQLALIIFGAYILFQILKKILGGSWSTEDIVVALVLFNTGIIFSIIIMLVQLRSDQRYLRRDLEILIRDFRKFVAESRIKNHLK